MNRKNITVGAILGVALMGSLWALGHEVPPRPRPVMPPESEGTIETSLPANRIDNRIDSTPLPAVPSVTTLPEPKGAVLPAWPKEIPTTLPEPKGGSPEPVDAPPLMDLTPLSSPSPSALPSLPPPASSQIQQVQSVQPPPDLVPPVAMPPAAMPPVPTSPVEIPAPLPPVAPTPSAPPLPAPMPPKLDPVPPPPPTIVPPAIQPTAPPIEAPKLPPVPEPKATPPIAPPVAPPVASTPKPLPAPSATPTPWNPAENAQSKFPPLPQIIETPPAAPTTPPPAAPVEPNVSRFVVPKAPPVAQPQYTPPPVVNNAPPPFAPQSVPNVMPPIGASTPVPQYDAPYFTMVKRWRQPEITPTPKTPTVYPRIENSRPPEMKSDTHAHVPTPFVEQNPGVHTPQITVEKRGPFFHKAGNSMKYQITLRNVGTLTAQNVRVEDEIPGAQVLATTPIADQLLAERIIWVLPTMKPGEERLLQEELQPARPGDVVSTTSVHVYASTSFRTRVEGDVPIASPITSPIATPLVTPKEPSIARTPVSRSVPDTTPGPLLDIPPGGGGTLPPGPGPILTPGPSPEPGPILAPVPESPVTPPKSMPMTVEVKALPVVGIGQKLEFEVIVSNKSLLPLTGMMLYGKIPTGLVNPNGENIGADLPNLAAGDTKSYKMPVTAVAPGKYTVEIRVTAAPNFELVARPLITVETTGLTLTQQIAGGRLVMGKDNDIKITVTNNQPTPMSQIQLVDVIPEGLDYVNSSDRGLYQVNNRTITWLIDTLPAGGTRTVTLRVQPKSGGPITHDVVLRMGASPEVKSSATYTVDSFSTLQVTVQGRDSVLEEGKDTVYAVKVTNTGTSVATNIHVGLTPTDGLQFGGFAQAPTAFRMNGKEILFAPIPRLAPGATTTIHLGLKGIQSGDQRVRVQVASDQMRTPLVREEMTRVYKDR